MIDLPVIGEREEKLFVDSSSEHLRDVFDSYGFRSPRSQGGARRVGKGKIRIGIVYIYLAFINKIPLVHKR